MSRLEELIEKLCPDGVEYISLKNTDIFSFRYGKGNKIPVDTGGIYDVYGANGIVSHINEYNCEDVSIIGHIGAVGLVNRCKGKCFVTYNGTIAQVVDKNKVNTQYLYYVLTTLDLPSYKKGSQPFLSVSDFENVKIPVPPLEVQSEIVKRLDVFAEYTTILTDELTARKKQYDEIAYRLLIKYNVADKYSVKDICSVTKGKTPIQKADPGEYPLVVTTQERKNCNTYQYDDEAVCVPLVSSRGHGVASLNHVYYQEGKFALGNILCAMTSNDKSFVLAKYLYYYFECTKDYTLVPLMKGGANVSMHIPDIEKVKVPVPSIEKQKDIIAKLEILEEYCNIALPAEIEARQKQYEYYRDKLLSFKSLSPNS